MKMVTRERAAWSRMAVVALAVSLVAAAGSRDVAKKKVTFTEDVAPILMDNCVSCHRPGEIAPMSLLTYEEARPWAKSIKKAVKSREMPPWDADPRFGHWANDISLSDEEIRTIVTWVDQGGRRGEGEMPPVPELTTGWRLGEPDFVIELPEIEVPADGPDLFPTPSVTIELPESRWIRGVEIRPGDREVNHHVVLFMGGNGGRRNESSGGFFDVLAVWAVGTPPSAYPQGMGRWIEKGATLTTNMHFHPIGEERRDKTRVGLYFGEGEMEKEIKSVLAGNVTFAIPPGAADHEVTASYTFAQDSRMISFFPHMHLRGKDMSFVATYPDGERQTLLSVPDYDFNWQWFYYPEELLPVPRGTTIDIVAHYNNSKKNPDNPDPSKTVTFGLESTDEMMFGVFEFIAEEGVSPKPITLDERIEAILSALPSDSAYRLRILIGSQETSAVLDLPRQGDGALHLIFGTRQMTLPVTDIAWSDDGFRFKLELNFAGTEMVLHAEGSQGEGGGITGAFSVAEGTGSSPSSGFARSFNLQGFEGERR